LVKEHVGNLDHPGRIELAAQLHVSGLSARKTTEITGVHCNTIRKVTKKNELDTQEGG